VELRYYLRLFKKWFWLVIVGAILGLVGGYIVSLLTVPVYQSTVTLLISQGADPLRDQYTAMIASQRAAITYVEQLKSSEVLEQVARDLNIATPTGGLPAAVLAQNVRDTQLIRVSVEDINPARAQAIANQIAKVFNEQLNTFQRERYRIVQEDMDRQVAETRKKIDETQKALAPLGDSNDPKALAAPEFVRTERQRLQLELTTLQSQYSVLLASAQNVRLAASRYTDAVTVSSPAKMPIAPIRPRTSTNILIGLAVGTLIGLGIAFLIEYLDDSLKTSDDVMRVLELGTLGNVVRFPKGTKSPLVALDSPRAPYVEAYRNLRTNLQFSFAVDSTATLVVASAEPGEGKSTTIANLAVVMAQVGKRVLLVDTDLRRPTQHHIFGVPAEPGLTDVFLGEQTFDQVVRETPVPSLHLLTSGRLPPNPAELLASAWMDRFIMQMQERYDVVLFDAPPILPVTDAILLASKTKHLVWIISAGKTRADTLRRAREALLQVDAKILGVVLNRISGGSGYGYYYYYYYSKDGTKQKRSPSERVPNTPTATVIAGNGHDKTVQRVTPPESMPE